MQGILQSSAQAAVGLMGTFQGSPERFSCPQRSVHGTIPTYGDGDSEADGDIGQ